MEDDTPVEAAVISPPVGAAVISNLPDDVNVMKDDTPVEAAVISPPVGAAVISNLPDD